MSAAIELAVARLGRVVDTSLERCANLDLPPIQGKLTRLVGLTLQAAGCGGAVGDGCKVIASDGQQIDAEIVGFSSDTTYLMPIGDARGLQLGARVVPAKSVQHALVGEGLLGRIVGGNGEPLDGRGALACAETASIFGSSINPLLRSPINEPLDVGVRAINSLLTVGKGQRLGLFAGSGVGKSVLLGMMSRYTSADVIVVGLIGERGREVKEFVDNILGPEDRKRAIVVATPADQSPLMRLHGAWLATCYAEYFRSRGKHVLLLMDSLTRFAQAQREIGLAIGEAPATKGYPPSVFARLPQLVERAGLGAGGDGSITAFYTVLTEGDDLQDPIADAARAILDGHIVLSRSLADSGHFPAIDIEASISRVMTEIVPNEQLQLARELRQLIATHRHHQDLVAIGAYKEGVDARLDRALRLWPSIQHFLQQDVSIAANRRESSLALRKLLETDGD
ncbi:MAG: FliI/YscN family ATPase [Steroidobacteraceae bacterium]